MLAAVKFVDGEISEYRFVQVAELDSMTIPRLARRLEASLSARTSGQPAYLEFGANAGDHG
jgi:hypothetical protein